MCHAIGWVVFNIKNVKYQNDQKTSEPKFISEQNTSQKL